MDWKYYSRLHEGRRLLQIRHFAESVKISSIHTYIHTYTPGLEFYRAIAVIAVEGEQNAVDHCGNDGKFLAYSAIFILFTVHYHFDT